MPLFFSSIAVALLFLFPNSLALPHQAVNDLRPRQTASAPAGASSSTADQLIEDIERLNQTLTDLPEDAYNFLNEVGDKHFDPSHKLFGTFGSIVSNAKHYINATGVYTDSAEPHYAFNSDTDPLFGERYDAGGFLASCVQRYYTFAGSFDSQSILGESHDASSFLSGTIQRYYTFAGSLDSQSVPGELHNASGFLSDTI
ncbi:hypothetical protein BC567DRAFT_284168 [Phyllosticta citribraziliensis]